MMMRRQGVASGAIKDAIGVLFVVITGLLYATGVTEPATDVVSDVGLDESSVGAAIEGPPGSGCRGADYPLALCGATSPCNLDTLDLRSTSVSCTDVIALQAKGVTVTSNCP